MNEIADPAATLSAIRTQAQELEHKEPHLALHVRHAKAIVHAANTAFVGKINGWFDAAMARATQQYTARARAVTVVAAFFVAIVLQFNSIDLLQRLSTDTTFRSSLVEMAKVEQARIDSMASAPAGDTTGELELLKARRQEIDAHLATLRTPELSILPDHLIWQSVPRGRVSRDPLWRGPYPSRLQLVAGGTTYDIRPAWRDDYLVDLHAAIEASGAPVSVGFVRGRDFLVLRAERPFVPMLFVADEKGAQFRDVPGIPAGTVAEADLRLTDAWPVDKARLGPMQLMIDSTPIPVPLGTDAAPVVVDRATAMGRAAMMGRLRDALSRVAPALRVDVRCERNRRAVKCPADEATAAGVEHVLVLSAKSKAIRDIRLLSDPADPFSNRLEDVERRPTGWRVAASDLPAGGRSPLRLFAYDRQGDAPDTLDDESRFVDIAPLPPVPTGQQAPVATASDSGQGSTTRFVRRPIGAVAAGPQITEVERIAHGLNAELRANRASRNGAAEGWPHALTAERFTDDQLVLTSSRVGPLELRYAPGRPETNILGRPLERVRPWTEWSTSGSATGFFDGVGNAFGPQVFGILLSWALLSLGAPFWFDALKNALKLRPSAAVTEERNSRERQEHNNVAGTTRK
jgi:hypothetical protein